MNTPQNQDIKDAFQHMQGKQDLLHVLNMAKSVIIGDKASPFTLRQLTYYADYRLAKRRYRTFSIPKKRGGERQIHAPVPGLLLIQRCLNYILQTIYEEHYHRRAFGFIPGRSIVDNARLHVGKTYVYNIDIKNFFPSIGLYDVKYRLMREPFQLDGDREPLAFLIANLCCHNMDQDGNGKTVTNTLPVLPQGAPTSPLLSNIIVDRMDRRLHGAAKKFGALYSRYADDLTFSSHRDVFDEGNPFLREIERIIHQQKLTINPQKVRLQTNAYRQEVTGLIVNEKVNVPRKFIKDIRKWLYLWETYGYERAEQIFECDYKNDGGRARQEKNVPPLISVLGGKLQYLKMISTEDDRYTKLRIRFDTLANKFQTQLAHYDPDRDIEFVLSLFENNNQD